MFALSKICSAEKYTSKTILLPASSGASVSIAAIELVPMASDELTLYRFHYKEIWGYELDSLTHRCQNK